MNVEAINAVTREKARIREAVIKLSEEKGIVAGFTAEQEVTWIPRGEVLAIISENCAGRPPASVQIKCACDETQVLKAVFATTPETEKNLKEAMKITPLDRMRHHSIGFEPSVIDGPTEKIPESEWNLGEFKENPVTLHSHKTEEHE